MLRKALASKALIQLDVTIPIYTLTKKMKNIVIDYIKELDKNLLIRNSIPYDEVYTARYIECNGFKGYVSIIEVEKDLEKDLYLQRLTIFFEQGHYLRLVMQAVNLLSFSL
jgi:hypothetical protein